MKSKLLLLTLFIVCFIILSCEGNRIAKGIVYDTETMEPLDSVYCENLSTDKPYVMYTDSTGSYFMSGDFAGCVPECPDLIVRFSKPGRNTTT